MKKYFGNCRGLFFSRRYATNLSSMPMLHREKLDQILSIPDLSDPRNGVHAINIMVSNIFDYMRNKFPQTSVEIKRGSQISTVHNEFDRLFFPADSPSRSPIYTRFIDDSHILRTHTTSVIPGLLDKLGESPSIEDVMYLCPGICYRRDVMDKIHVGEPHQLDLWRISRREKRLERDELVELIKALLKATVPEYQFRLNETQHPYTINGLEVEILLKNGQWLELLESGEVHPKLLEQSGLDPSLYSGLAMGMGLDRLVMLIKSISDIRLLRSNIPSIQVQMQNLDPYKPISKYPAIRRDISIATNDLVKEEDICETIRLSFPGSSELIQEVKVLSEHKYETLRPEARDRLNIVPGQKNLLIKLIFSSYERTLLKSDANEFSSQIASSLSRLK